MSYKLIKRYFLINDDDDFGLFIHLIFIVFFGIFFGFDDFFF